MDDRQRQQIRELREEGYGYGRIAQILEISENTIKTYCRRHGLGGVVANPAPINGEGLEFIAFYYNGRRLILKKEFERYLKEHPEIRRRERRWQENQDCEEIQNTEYSEEANQ